MKTWCFNFLATHTQSHSHHPPGMMKTSEAPTAADALASEACAPDGQTFASASHAGDASSRDVG
jgi:hypothetical protein